MTKPCKKLSKREGKTFTHNTLSLKRWTKQCVIKLSWEKNVLILLRFNVYFQCALNIFIKSEHDYVDHYIKTGHMFNVNIGFSEWQNVYWFLIKYLAITGIIAKLHLLIS